MRKIKDNKTRKRKANKIIGKIQGITEHTPLHALAIAVENIELGIVRYTLDKEETFDEAGKRLDLDINNYSKDIALCKELLIKIKTCYTMTKKSFDMLALKFKELNKSIDVKMSTERVLSEIEKREKSKDVKEIKICNVPDKDFDFVSFLTVFSQYISEKIDLCDKYLSKKEKRYLKIFSGKLNNLREEILDEVRI
jgi:hypothetical protein